MVALEVCPQRFGFVVFDGPVTLLDWGVRNYRGRRTLRQTAIREKISTLLKLYAPTALVMRRRESLSRNARKETLSAARMITVEARKCSVKTLRISPLEVRRFFSAHGCRTKHQIGSLIATWFEELSFKLPPARKPWQPEAHAAAVFDAVATGIAYFSRERTGRPKTAGLP
jgi:hypothetical protein